MSIHLSPLGIALCLMLLFPIVLSPTHPVAVYGYLADISAEHVFSSVNAPTDELKYFLTTRAQIGSYQNDLREDLLDTTTGRLFVIVRGPDGRLTQKKIRTWNGFLPASAPKRLLAWADRKEIPFLGDEVTLWSSGYAIEAHGHYHAFGGPPSPGDRVARRLSSKPEIVVANGLIPSVYLNNELVPYGRSVSVPGHIYRHMRALEGSLSIEVNGGGVIPAQPSESLKSFLGFLREYQGIDIGNIQDISRGTRRLLTEYKTTYRGILSLDAPIQQIQGNPDLYNIVKRLDNVELWAIYHMRPLPDESENTSPAPKTNASGSCATLTADPSRS